MVLFTRDRPNVDDTLFAPIAGEPAMDTPHRAARRLLTSAAVGSLLVALVHAAGCAFAPARADTAGGPSVRTATDGPDARSVPARGRSTWPNWKSSMAREPT